MDGIGVNFLSELVGTAMLIILGGGVVAAVSLTKSKGFGAGFLMVTIGWGFAVFAGVTVSYSSGGQLNPAVSLGLALLGKITVGEMFLYWLAQLIGAIIGAVIVWLAYKQHFDEEPDAANKLGVFSTGPAIRSYGWNLVTEVIGTSRASKPGHRPSNIPRDTSPCRRETPFARPPSRRPMTAMLNTVGSPPG